MVAIVRLYIAWERSWVQYATKKQKTKTKKQTNKKNKEPKTKNRKLWCRDLEHRDGVYTYIISGNRILYTYIHCQGARDLDIIVFCFCFWFFVFFCFCVFCLWVFFVFWFFCLLLHIVLNSSLKLCTTWWWPPLWPKHVVVSYLPPYSYIIIII